MSLPTLRSGRAPAAITFLAMASMIRRFAWWVTSTSMSVERDAGGLGRADRDRADRRGRPAEDGLALLDEVAVAALDPDRLERSSRRCPRPPGRCPVRRTAVTTAAPAPSAKMIAVARSSGLVQSVSFSEPTTSTFVRRSDPDGLVGGGERVAEAGAGGVDVERPGRVDAQRAGDLGRACGTGRVQAAGGDDDRVDVAAAAGRPRPAPSRWPWRPSRRPCRPRRRTGARRCRPGCGSTRRWCP